MPRESAHLRSGAIGSETESPAFLRARKKLESALRSSDDTVLLTGPSDSEKLLLLDSIWKRPPRGFAPIPVPCRNADAEKIAETILATLRHVTVREADGALARMLRTQSLRGLRPVFLLDDLEAVSHAALSQLRSIADGSRVEVRWIAAGSDGPASQSALDILPRPVHVVAVDAAAPAPRKSESAMTSPKAADIPRRPASSEPAPAPRAAAVRTPRTAPVRTSAPPPRESELRPIRASVAASPRRAPPLRSDAQSDRPRVRARPKPAPRRPLVSPVAVRAIAVAIVGCAALALLIDRGSLFFAWVEESTATTAAAARERVGPKFRGVVSDATTFAENARSSITAALDSLDELAVWGPHEEIEPLPVSIEQISPPVSAEPPAIAEPAAAPEPAPAPAAPPIQVGINSDPWSNVAVDGVDFGSTPLSVELSPGMHQFRAEMADGRVVEKKIEVAEGQNQVVFR